jgi:Zn-dependent metalloprotease
MLGTTKESSLHVAAQIKSPAPGQTIVRLQESHSGVPVIGGQAVLAVDSSQRVVAAQAETLQGQVPSTDPNISSVKASQLAVAVTSKSHGPGVRAVGTPTLQIFDPRILGGPGPRKALLTWKVDVERAGNSPIKRTVYIDATAGWKVASITRTQATLNRRICDANSSASNVPCSLSTPVRTEGQFPLVGDSNPNSNASVRARDVNNAYDYSAVTYDFFSGLGRDGIDGMGQRIDSTVRYCALDSSTSPPRLICPYANAYWDGSQMVYGKGYSAADDVVAHELTHGVTQNTSALFYYFQSGAINEAISDVFGEFVDQSDGVGTDTAEVKWLIGEDLPGGALRSMSNPGSFGDPDKTSTSKYVKDKYGDDSGGVHTNSGVANKAAFLMTDGGTFNGQTITGIGVSKASRIWYQTELLLTSGADFQDLGNTLVQACNSLTGTASITSSDCDQVEAATLATEMNLTPTNASIPQAVVCSTGVPTNLYSNNFEGAGNHTWTASNLISGGTWTYGSLDKSNGLYSKSGTDNLWGDDPDVRSDTVMTMPGTIRVPVGGAFVHFKHAFGFETDTVDPSTGTRAMGFYDGGVLEYSTNNGTTWQDAGPLFSDNGYTGTIENGYGADNPLKGREAFVGASFGYQSSRLNLAPLSGKDVKLRFRIGSDAHIGDAGWFIDDFRAYTCAVSDTVAPQTTIAAGGASGFPTDGSKINYTAPSFTFSADESGSTFECRMDGGTWATCSSPHMTASLGDGAHTFEVRAYDPSGNVDATPSSMAFTVDATGPPVGIDSGPIGYSASTSASFAFSTNEVGATFECQLDAKAWASCRSPLAYSNLAQGQHIFRVRAIDSLGNRTAIAGTRSFTIDTVKPNTSITTAPTSTKLTKPTFKFTRSPLTDPGTFNCRMDTGPWAACMSPWQPLVALKKGTHKFSVAAVDLAGNTDATPAVKTFRVY